MTTNGRPNRCVSRHRPSEAFGGGEPPVTSRTGYREGRTGHPKKSSGHLLNGTESRFRFMKDHRKVFSVERMAKMLSVSKSGYYAFISRPLSRQKKERRHLDVLVKAAFESSQGRYGSWKISRALAAKGTPYSRTRVADSMRRQTLRSKVRRKFVVTTDTKHTLKASPNLLNREFQRDRPNKVWVSDITYLPSRAGWLYLAVFIDLFSRRVVGWCVSPSLGHETVLVAEVPPFKWTGS